MVGGVDLVKFGERVKYWYTFAPRVWIALAVGWLAVLFSLTPCLRLRDAGALLVCAAIVAEVFNDKKHQLFVKQSLPGMASFYLYRETPMSGDGRTHQGIEITPHQVSSGKSTVNADSWHLYHLANESEFRGNKPSRDWDLPRTMKRLESRVAYAITFSVIVGTALSAFGS